MIYLVLAVVAVAVFLSGVWFLRKVWFYRDPDHSATPQDDRILLSPVYGRVAYVRRICGGVVVSEKLGEEITIREITKCDWPEGIDGDGWLIGIAMTPLDIHYQYAPVAGVMGEIRPYKTGFNLPMFDFWEYVRITWLRKHVQLFARRYTLENERQTMWLQANRFKVALVLIADKFVDKITTYTEEGASVRAGGKLSFIARGSQVDLVVCGHPDLKIEVREGQGVYGPLTVVARSG